MLTKESNEIDNHFRCEIIWQTPWQVIRELILNALIHRDLTRSSEVEIIRYDNRLEIISPGALPPVFDILNIYENPSEIRNKILAPIFKELDLIEQWGNGLKKIKRELKEYPELKLNIKEISDSVMVQLLKTEYIRGQSGGQSKFEKFVSIVIESSRKKEVILMLVDGSLSSSEITEKLKLKNRTSVIEHHLKPLTEMSLIEFERKDIKQSRLQKYRLTETGKMLANELTK